jgi:hypothetical protein
MEFIGVDIFLHITAFGTIEKYLMPQRNQHFGQLAVFLGKSTREVGFRLG